MSSIIDFILGRKKKPLFIDGKINPEITFIEMQTYKEMALRDKDTAQHILDSLSAITKEFSVDDNDSFNDESPKARIAIPADVKRLVELRAKNQCEYYFDYPRNHDRCNQQNRSVLHFHHKDGDPSNNAVTNILLCCANHHKILGDKLRKGE